MITRKRCVRRRIGSLTRVSRVLGSDLLQQNGEMIVRMHEDGFGEMRTHLRSDASAERGGGGRKVKFDCALFELKIKVKTKSKSCTQGFVCRTLLQGQIEGGGTLGDQKGSCFRFSSGLKRSKWIGALLNNVQIEVIGCYFNP